MSSPAKALVVVPPYLKYAAGPLLGPALLAGAARAAGHEADVLDLNIRWLRRRLPPSIAPSASRVAGDHAKPGQWLSAIQHRQFVPFVESHLDCEPFEHESPGLTLTASHEAIAVAAHRIASSAEGEWMREIMAACPRPDVFGVSVLFSGQVLFGLAASILAKTLWPEVLVVWGGPHVTALRDRIAADHRFGSLIDAFVFGYAERTFVDLLDAVAANGDLPETCVPAGEKRAVRADEDPAALPFFQDLDSYGLPRLTLPAQLSRGCSYSRCEFCTYPAIEGSYRALDHAVLGPVVDTAARLSAHVAFKDSLLVPKRLGVVADLVGSRVRWAACTKLHPSLDDVFLGRLARGGCDTLELGLETIDPESQRLIDKKQCTTLFTRVLDAAERAGVALVVNYITGFPGENITEAADGLAWVREELARRAGLRSIVEHNTFQLERLSPMARNAGAHGIRIRREWPWASVLGWEPVIATKRRLGLLR